MSYIGKTPTSVPLSSSDLEDGIITTAKIADDAATADKIANAVNSAITANTSKTTNATHSGEVTGSGALTIADNAVTLAKMAAGTDGNIISYDASGNPVAVATGSDGQVLTSTGAGSPPVFEALPAGGLYTQTATASLTSAASSITLQNAFSSTYTNYMITIESLLFAAASISLYFIPIDSSGNTSTSHKYAARGDYANGAQTWKTNSAHSYVNISNDIYPGVSQNCNGTINVFSPMLTTAGITSYSWHLKSSKAYEEAGIVNGAGSSSAGVAYTGFKLQMSTNNITSCKIACYGITNPS